MIVWTIHPNKARVELDAEGWWVYRRGKAYHFGTHAECLAFLAGLGLIQYEQIDILIDAARRRFA